MKLPWWYVHHIVDEAFNPQEGNWVSAVAFRHFPMCLVPEACPAIVDT